MISFDPLVSLGPLKESNLKKYYDWRNDPRIWKWCRQSDLLTEWGHRSWFEGLARNESVRMYEILAPTQELVGVCGLTSLDPLNQRAEFSLYVGPKFQNKGFATAALKTLFRHGFTNLNLNLIWGETFQGNPAAKLFERLGMVKEGRRRQFYFQEGQFIDADLYSVTRSEFLRPCSSSYC